MIRYRPFLNSDPPAIAEIWRSQPPLRALVQPMTPAVLDRWVLAKPYFDRQGLIVAVDGQRPVGFVHAGFGPREDRQGLNRGIGMTCLLMVSGHDQREGIAHELLRHSEQYLRRNGANALYGGSRNSVGPFYLGLYGGSRLPGVLLSDSMQRELYQAAGYTETERHIVFECELTNFRPAVDRQMIQLRREFQLTTVPDSVPANWWEACAFGQIDRTEFRLVPIRGGPACGKASFWDMEPLADTWGVHAMGLLQLELDDQQGRAELATFFLGEAMRCLKSLGVTLVEVQAASSDSDLIDVCTKIGFRRVDQGIQYQKQI